MAKQTVDLEMLSKKLIQEIQSGIFKPVYLLMGDESHYPDIICQAIIDNCVDEAFKDFNETICYGNDVDPSQVITAARRYPMMSERQVVVVKEAQLMKGLDELAVYCNDPLDSTVLVILMRGASADKRKALYKSVMKTGIVIESNALRDYEVPNWISRHFASLGLNIEPQAAALLAEDAGTDLSTICMETDKLRKNLPEDCRTVTVADIEKNIGLSRQFSIFELTRELSMHNGPKALRIATHLGNSAKFVMPAAISALYTHFNRILRYAALLESKRYPSPEEKAAVLKGLNPYFYKEYDTAVRNYPLPKAMAIMSMLCEYDYLGKGGDGGKTEAGDLLVELTAKILNV